MTTAADLVCLGGEVHTLTDPDRTASAVAVRDGRVVRVGSDYEMRFLRGVETTTVDLGGRVLLPGFIDAHTHLSMVGRYRAHADLRDADGPADCVATLRGAADGGDGWVAGFGFDESRWADSQPPDRDVLDRVATDRPVAAFREDMHTAVVNGPGLAALEADPGEPGVRTDAGDPTGVLVEAAAVRAVDAVAAEESAVELVRAARRVAHQRGVTAVDDMVRRPATAAAYRRLERAGDLSLRVRLNYRADRLDAVEALGLLPGTGGGFVSAGAVKAFVDGSIGSHTARLEEPYATREGRGEWVTPPEEVVALLERVEGAGRQLAVHAIGDAAVGAVADAVAAVDPDPVARHRIEHAELADDEQIEALAGAGVVASVQPNFHKWAGEGGLYERRLGAERTARTNRLAAMRSAGLPLAFGSDCMPLDPLVGVHHAVTAPADAQRLGVTEALRAYTAGSAYARFAEDRLGTVEAGKRGDFVVLEHSPWEPPDAIEDIGVAATVVDGELVYDDR